jgi:cobyrinic acid a,c-diamide synthase
MTGPDEDPFPVREWDPMEDEAVDPQEADGMWFPG